MEDGNILCTTNVDGYKVWCSPANCGCWPCCHYCRHFIWKSQCRKHCKTDSCPIHFENMDDFIKKNKFDLWSVGNGNS